MDPPIPPEEFKAMSEEDLLAYLLDRYPSWRRCLISEDLAPEELSETSESREEEM